MLAGPLTSRTAPRAASTTVDDRRARRLLLVALSRKTSSPRPARIRSLRIAPTALSKGISWL